MSRFLLLSMLFGVALLPASGAEVWLSDLDLSLARQGWGNAQRDKSVLRNPLTIAGRKFDKGVGTHANSEMNIDLKAKATRFVASVGLDDDSRDLRGVDRPAVRFIAVGDGRILWQSPVMILGREARPVDLEVTGVRWLSLLVVMANEKDSWEHANWAEAKFVMTDNATPEMLSEAAKQNDAVLAGFFHGMKKGRPVPPKRQ